MQSPILIKKHLEQRNFPPFEFINYNCYTPIVMENNGYTVKICPNCADAQPIIRGGGLYCDYILQELVFHWSAEHMLFTCKYPVEGQFVHYAKKYGSYENAKNYRDGIAILSVFYKIAKLDYPAFAIIIEAMPAIERDVNRLIEIPGSISFGWFLPNHLKFFRYIGSMTEPNYEEVVIWTIFEEPLFMSDRQYCALTHIYDQECKVIECNARPLQPISNRKVYESYLCI